MLPPPPVVLLPDDGWPVPGLAGGGVGVTGEGVGVTGEGVGVLGVGAGAGPAGVPPGPGLAIGPRTTAGAGHAHAEPDHRAEDRGEAREDRRRDRVRHSVPPRRRDEHRHAAHVRARDGELAARRVLLDGERMEPELGRRDRAGCNRTGVGPPEQDPLHIGSIAGAPDIHQFTGSPD